MQIKETDGNLLIILIRIENCEGKKIRKTKLKEDSFLIQSTILFYQPKNIEEKIRREIKKNSAQQITLLKIFLRLRTHVIS